MANYKNEITVVGSEANLHVLYNTDESGISEGLVRLVWFLEGESEEWDFSEAFELNAFEIEGFSEEVLKEHFEMTFLKSHVANGGYVIRLFIK